MRCPFCGEPETKVIDSRLSHDSYSIKRRRSCISCQTRFNTYEKTDLTFPRVLKNNQSSEIFSQEKIVKSINIALEKRKVDSEDIDKAIQSIINKCATYNEKEISTTVIGDFVMQELLLLDHVAYVRYASVYLSFRNIEEFKHVVEGIENSISPEMKKLQKELLKEDD